MQTSFPDLPFTNYGDAVLHTSGIHSAARSCPRTYPRTDLQTIKPWTNFLEDIHQAILSATAHAQLPHTPFGINGATWDTFVENEEKLRGHALGALHVPVEAVLTRLGVNGNFVIPGGGNIAIVGDPDFSWVMSTGAQQAQLHPKVVVEYKTWWAADLLNLISAFNGTHHDTLSQQSIHALEQTYGYMTFNNNKFGILTNWKHALFLRRDETPDRKTLNYHLIELNRAGQPISMLKAWVGMVLLAEDNWFYASPTPSSAPPGRSFGTSKAARTQKKRAIEDAEYYHMKPVDGTYKCLTIDFRLCQFDLSSARRAANGCVVTARFPSLPFFPLPVGGHDHQVICKVIDVLRYPDAANSLDYEAHAYTALKNLQGKVIPTLHGFYEVWGILRFLALEHVGNAISEHEQINERLRTKMKAALQCIHNAGFIHGDIARRNFCRTDRGDIFLVDLERCQRYRNQSELGSEMVQVDEL